MNVALTRARRSLWVVGHQGTLQVRNDDAFDTWTCQFVFLKYSILRFRAPPERAPHERDTHACCGAPCGSSATRTCSR